MNSNEFFTEELIAATLLWARARVGEYDCDDLSQQILCEALASHRAAKSRGQEIASFHGWYWKIAENQLKIFLRLKYKSAVSLNELEDFIASEETVDGDLLSEEERSELNLAVSRLSAIHREIIIDYYLREKSVSTIATERKIPLGTVKRRLFDAREDLKRSINMEKTGRAAYAPPEVRFVGSLGAPSYWNDINDLITKQILAACRKSARTIREISDEIAVAPVYFEEKIDYLVSNKFLRETSKGKYLSDIVFLPAQSVLDFKYECRRVWREVAPLVRDAILSVEEELRGFDYYGNDFTRGRLMWLWYAWAATRLSTEMVLRYRAGKTLPNGSPLPANNGKDYRVTGYILEPDETLVERGGEGFVSNMHWSFRTSEYRMVTYANLYESEPFGYGRDKILNDSNIALYMRLAKSPGGELTEIEQSMAAELVANGYIEKRGEGLWPTVPIMSYRVWGDIEEILRAAVEPIAQAYYGRIAQLGEMIYLPHIRADLYEEYVNWVMQDAFFGLWSFLDCELLEPRTLELPHDFARSSYCTCIYFR